MHTKGKPLAPEIDLSTLAAGTPGFTGADLANLVNEAALLAARRGKKIIEQDELEEGIMRVVAGPEKKARLLSEHERKITAYHEGGHALVAAALRNSAPVTKITILPRGRALGYTMVVPENDKYSVTRNELLDQMAYAMGGRVAEEIVFHDPSTGASNDLQRATEMARKMVREFGMSERIGPMAWGQEGQVFLGEDLMHAARDYSDVTSRVIDEEVERILAKVTGSARVEDREAAVAELQEHFIDQALVVPLFEEPQVFGFRRTVQGFGTEPVGRPRFYSVWLADPDRAADAEAAGTPAGTTAAAAGAQAGTTASAAAITSCLRMRPPRPVPATAPKA